MRNKVHSDCPPHSTALSLSIPHSRHSSKNSRTQCSQPATSCKSLWLTYLSHLDITRFSSYVERTLASLLRFSSQAAKKTKKSCSPLFKIELNPKDA